MLSGRLFRPPVNDTGGSLTSAAQPVSDLLWVDREAQEPGGEGVLHLPVCRTWPPAETGRDSSRREPGPLGLGVVISKFVNIEACAWFACLR